MKTPLRYQATCFDCGTTSMVNALLYLMSRRQLPYECVRYITSVMCDRDLEAVTCGERGSGTSAAAMAFACSWLDGYARKTGLPLRCKYLCDDCVTMREDSEIPCALERGAIAVLGCCLGSDHYVLATGFEDDGRLRVFDPYYDTWPLHELDVEVVGVEPVDRPHECNRLVERWVLDAPAGTPYSLACKSKREAALFWRCDGCSTGPIAPNEHANEEE